MWSWQRRFIRARRRFENSKLLSQFNFVGLRENLSTVWKSLYDKPSLSLPYLRLRCSFYTFARWIDDSDRNLIQSYLVLRRRHNTTHRLYVTSLSFKQLLWRFLSPSVSVKTSLRGELLLNVFLCVARVCGSCIGNVARLLGRSLIWLFHARQGKKVLACWRRNIVLIWHNQKSMAFKQKKIPTPRYLWIGSENV